VAVAIRELSTPTGRGRSFLKWAGGKTRTAPTLAALAPAGGFRGYVEPFCGSAAVFFTLAPARAILADANEELVVTLCQVRDAPQAVMDQLDMMRNTRAYFERVRKQDPARLSDLERAARLIYLNKTAFRGLWRVNRQGRFNTPYGQYRRPYYNPDTLLAAAAAMRGVDIRCADFADVLKDVRKGDWVYLDPPYVPDRKWGDFTRYTAGQFGPCDQERLAATLRKLDKRGVRWLLSNSNTPKVHELYDGFRIAVLSTRRDITLQSTDRDSTDLVVSNYDCGKHPALTPVRKSRR
jgi:DNA adenine methylase